MLPEQPERKRESYGTKLFDAGTGTMGIIPGCKWVPKVRYSYCSLKGRLFHCVSRSREEAERLCEDWLVGQDRCYRN